MDFMQFNRISVGKKILQLLCERKQNESNKMRPILFKTKPAEPNFESDLFLTTNLRGFLTEPSQVVQSYFAIVLHALQTL